MKDLKIIKGVTTPYENSQSFSANNCTACTDIAYKTCGTGTCGGGGNSTCKK
jgi:hypothetical protein